MNYIHATGMILSLMLLGASVFAGYTYVEIGQGLHPVAAGAASLLALGAGFWSAGQIKDEA